MSVAEQTFLPVAAFAPARQAERPEVTRASPSDDGTLQYAEASSWDDEVQRRRRGRASSAVLSRPAHVEPSNASIGRRGSDAVEQGREPSSIFPSDDQLT